MRTLSCSRTAAGLGSSGGGLPLGDAASENTGDGASSSPSVFSSAASSGASSGSRWCGGARSLATLLGRSQPTTSSSRSQSGTNQAEENSPREKVDDVLGNENS